MTNTFAGYITYCSQQGIISGYADGTFRPTGTLSGNAFMKMLLGALGYDSSIEGYTGANWQVSVIKQASGIGLDDGNDEFVGSKAVTREEAALYAFNMLQATMVEYDQQNTIVVGDITINTTSSRKDVVNNDKNESISEDNKMQFAERYFDDLKLSDGTDDFARPANRFSPTGSCGQAGCHTVFWHLWTDFETAAPEKEPWECGRTKRVLRPVRKNNQVSYDSVKAEKITRIHQRH